MTKVEIPFSDEMAMAAINSKKIATTRSERKGKIGDWFEIDYPEPFLDEPVGFIIIDIWESYLPFIKEYYYLLEGFDSPESFEKTWKKLHRGHFTTDKKYFVHFFARLP
jgi:hypothetical protein